MWKLSPLCFLLLCALVSAQGSGNRSSLWQTLSGNQPLVIARGGFSGILPDSSLNAYGFAVQTGLPDTIVWCDLQLTKDGVGICFPDIKLDNASDIDIVYPKGRKTYLVNGVSTQGWFSVDFTLKDLEPVNLKQRIYSRSPNYDTSQNIILTVDDVVTNIKPPGLWLSVPHDAFFTQHNQSMRNFVVSASRRFAISYISSPEIGFLRNIASRFRTTKLVFQFLEPDQVEPTTNQTYGSLLTNLTLVKTFAAGIIVPKTYIIPVDSSLYLQQAKSLVNDAHAAGLEVFGYNFVNDATLPYNYSYDPVAEYLSFIDNGKFSLDGVISDFPMTASATIDCYAHMSKNDSVKANVLVISNEGASGDYPGCTDKAYEKAVSDGADILDCPVQITNDGIPFCLGSINLRDRTTVSQSDFINRATDNPELRIEKGIYAYNLTWSEIKTLQPAIYNPYTKYTLFRNPKFKNAGNFMQLSDFLTVANTSAVSGVIISIENAAYLAASQGLGVTDVVLDTLSKAGINKKVMIRSSDSAVLSKFKSSSNYELVYLVDDDVGDILNSTISEIKKFASSVVLSKESVYPTDMLFTTHVTTVVQKLQAFNLSVYVHLFQNEYVSQPWDFFSDPYTEINSHVSSYLINGVITDFPATAAKYKRNRCLGYEDAPPYMLPAPAGGLLSIMEKRSQPPAEAPNPTLTDESVIEPPLPPVRAPTNGSGTTAPGPVAPNGQPTLVGSAILSGISVFLAALVLC
ncbi:glycerophosphodiester phosphodiesterase GDPDL4-like [Salvia hispanica]|uniref:glycerophosphodiester phosphodiesterase GDPDL4-like n=1 Tax=Salvia hispanica TaxID=49212 RepID=UPI002009DB6E|nr:glycerophosphodiester phosphodiesterase GDPDL4-like [Salvia hispanica]